MIERISNSTVLLRPSDPKTESNRGSAMKVPTGEQKPADYLFDPRVADKLDLSQKSVREELTLIEQRSRERASEAEASGSQILTDEVMERSMRTSMARIRSLLYHVASVSGGNPELLKKAQEKVARELRDYDKVFKEVNLDSTEKTSEESDLNLSSRIDPSRLDAESARASLEAIEKAEAELDRRKVVRQKSDDYVKARTEAALRTTEQNLRAAKSALFPDDSVARAEEVVRLANASAEKLDKAQSGIRADDVHKLLS